MPPRHHEKMKAVRNAGRLFRPVQFSMVSMVSISRSISKMVQITSNLRSTKAITDYITLSDESATITARLKAITRELTELQPTVLEQIGEGRAVKIGSQVRTIKPGTTEKISRTCDDLSAVQWCKAHGLKFSTRSPEYVAPATFSALVRSSQMHRDFYEIETTVIVVVI